ncbi:MAG: XrtA system polysaccharide deacetylase [Planctomycetota bacterium]|nr:XrtA system polysaccharide deacetylase [Planctomycetota bacterium]
MPPTSLPSLPLTAGVPNALTVDVEDYFQVSAFADRVTLQDWDKYECRVEANTDRILEIFDQASVQGTFFILGWVAERYPGLVKRIHAAGHEIASHGYWHQLVYDLTPEEFAKDISDSKDAIANACGAEATAYRAPSFSITPRSEWALDILIEQGFTLDSSIFPIKGHDRYGFPDAPKHIHTIERENESLIEFPPTSGSLGPLPVPIGGGYFRLFPLALTLRAIEQVRNSIGPGMFYIHPWEIDPNQPKIQGASAKSRFRHYANLRKTSEKLRRMITKHSFAPIRNILSDQE